MSGVINSVGARSGVIGSTEIPGGYETGDWTPTCTVSISSSSGKYTKIGNIVFCFGYIQLGTADASSFGGLPYAPYTVGSGRTGGGPTTNSQEHASIFAVTYGATQTFRFSKLTAEITFTDNSQEIQFYLTYQI